MSSTLHADPNKIFEEALLPEIEARSRLHFHRLDPASREEAIQESVCMAWAMYRSAVARGRIDERGQSTVEDKPPVTPCSLAWFSNLSYDSGRRFCGQNKTDAMGEATHLAGRVRLVGLDDLNADGLTKALTDHRPHADPAQAAQVNIDWTEFARCDLLNNKSKAALPLLAAGFRNGELAKALGVCDARACQIKDLIGEAAVEFFGPDIKPPVRRAAKRQKGLRQPRRQRVARRKSRLRRRAS